MILSTTHSVPNREITEILGIARGSTVRSRNIGRDIVAGLKKITGGEIEEYTKLQAHAREQAIERMIEDAKKLNADAIVGINIATALVTSGAAEILTYGTAVKLK
ncbi:MAG: YbjQ family protein [Bacteroidales bacterium]|nr:YbjQ family protein [Bacteroidales bacterium]